MGLAAGAPECNLEKLIERHKAGVAIPVGQWLRGPLCAWADALLNLPCLKAGECLHPELITKVWLEHLSGLYDHPPRLWSVFPFQAWLEYQSKPHRIFLFRSVRSVEAGQKIDALQSEVKI